MKGRDKILTLNDTEQQLIVKGLYDIRSQLLQRNDPASDVEDLILRVIDEPHRKEQRRVAREER